MLWYRAMPSMKRRFQCTSERCSPALFLVALAAGGHGTAAIRVIRGAVGEIETVCAEQLGPKRFSQRRGLLLELSELA
jgi:hypothetical protein